MKDVLLTIESNVQVSSDTFLMKLVGDTSDIKNPGEFINLTIPGYYLRRPISVHDFSNNHVDILYKVLGHGTRDLSTFKKGETLQTLVGLGNGFEIKNHKKVLLVAGGIGIAPLYALAKALSNKGVRPTLVYGARSASDIVLVEEFEKYCDVITCTDDGSLGFKGNAIECIKNSNLEFDYYYSCGPHRMLEALAKAYPNGCVSLEARMGCGFGACMGCSIETINGPKRVCKEGPVFEASEVKF